MSMSSVIVIVLLLACALLPWVIPPPGQWGRRREPHMRYVRSTRKSGRRPLHAASERSLEDNY
jgi:hypothetical protein